MTDQTARVLTVRPTAAKFSADQIDLIKRTIAPGASDDELRLFMYQAERTGLDPLARQIYAIKRWDGQKGMEVMGLQTSIDGFRLIAERSGKYAGQVGPYWCGEDGQWQDVWVSDKAPSAARVGVLRTDFKEPCWGVARFQAYAQNKKGGGYTSMWTRMGDVMIAKCAESLALRKAFPQELAGIYVDDEMDQITNTPRENLATTRPNDITDVPPPDSEDWFAPATDGIKPLPKKEAREIGAKLGEEMHAIKDIGLLRAWKKKNEKRAQVLPNDWREILSGRYKEHRESLEHSTAKGDGIPNAATEPEKFLVWADKAMAATKTLEMLEALYNSEIEPVSTGLFPPDKDELVGMFGRHERRFEP